MPKILIAECKQEVSSFNPVPSSYADFDILFGADLLDFHHGLKSEIGGALDVFAEQGDIELIPTYSARAITSGGTLAADSFHRIGEEFLAAVRAAPLVLRHDVVGSLGDDSSDPNLEIREAAPLLQIAVRDRLRTNEAPRGDVDRAGAVPGHPGQQSFEILSAFLADMLPYDFAARIP